MLPNKWRVPRLFEGQTAVVCGGGPSLTLADVQEARNAPDTFLVGINDAYKMCPQLEVVYGCDLEWWQWPGLTGLSHYEEVMGLGPEVVAVTATKGAAEACPGLKFVEGQHGEGFSTDAETIHYGHNGGFQATNLAMLLGAAKVLLLGFDMRVHDTDLDAETGTLGATHWFGDHPNKVVSPYALFIRCFERAVELGLPVPVVNCTPRSALRCFPTLRLREALYGSRVYGTGIGKGTKG